VLTAKEFILIYVYIISIAVSGALKIPSSNNIKSARNSHRILIKYFEPVSLSPYLGGYKKDADKNVTTISDFDNSKETSEYYPVFYGINGDLLVQTEGRTSYNWCQKESYLPTIAEYLKRRAYVNIRTSGGTILYNAFYYDKLNGVEPLLEAESCIGKRNNYGQTPMDIAKGEIKEILIK
jgi:hypothetical protein